MSWESELGQCLGSKCGGRYTDKRGTALNLKGTSRTYITTVIPCLGNFDSLFGGFLSPLLEPLAPKMPNLTSAALSAFVN